MASQKTTIGTLRRDRLFFVIYGRLSWWVWLVTASLLAAGLAGVSSGFYAALALSLLQTLVIWIRNGSIANFSVQLRFAYTLLLSICFFPFMGWLFWLPTIGTFALNLFGYCLLARLLFLFPWNRTEPMSFELIWRTFLSRPRISVGPEEDPGGCAGGMCSISAQVRPRDPTRLIAGSQ